MILLKQIKIITLYSDICPFLDTFMSVYIYLLHFSKSSNVLSSGENKNPFLNLPLIKLKGIDIGKNNSEK